MGGRLQFRSELSQASQQTPIAIQRSNYTQTHLVLLLCDIFHLEVFEVQVFSFEQVKQFFQELGGIRSLELVMKHPLPSDDSSFDSPQDDQHNDDQRRRQGGNAKHPFADAYTNRPNRSEERRVGKECRSRW